MQRVLIADMSEAFTMLLEKELRKSFQVRTCSDGLSALQLLSSFQPDILIINMTLLYKDGLSVLREAVRLPRYILLSTTLITDPLLQVAQDKGVRRILQLPTVKSVCKHLAELLENPYDPNTTEDRVFHFLRALGIPVHLDGFQYLITGISLLAKVPEQRLSKELYPAIAAAVGNADHRAVERSIRTAIAYGWKHGNRAAWVSCFPCPDPDRLPRPTNKAFLSCLARLLNK